MNLQHRIDLMVTLGNYILSADEEWRSIIPRAQFANPWFIPEFSDLAARNIAKEFLSREKLERWISKYSIAEQGTHSKTIGIVMAGNIPLVGFHDLLCCFISGFPSMVKLSSKDEILIRHIVDKLAGMEPRVSSLIRFESMLKGCDAYIATGSNNSSRYFEYYFAKFPNIIRKNRTGIAILNGKESAEQLSGLADDAHLFFGLGCRNVTKIFVPRQYDFTPLLKAFGKYEYLINHNKYKNNYDYNLALHILNNKFYMTNGSTILIENDTLFSPISQVNYQYFEKDHELEPIKGNNDVQCIVGTGHLPFGTAQKPALDEYADGVDTMAFLEHIRSEF